MIVAIMLAVSIGSVVAGENAADGVQRQVWERYLGQKEADALGAKRHVASNADEHREPQGVMDAIREAREGFLAMAADYAAQFADIPTTEYGEGGIKGNWITPENADESRVLLYLHGGAYIIGSDHTPKAITAFLARDAGIRCFSLDYPLAPEHPFPAALDNAVQAYRMLLEEGISPNSIVVGGDSAGGGLALALLLAIREHKLPMPAGAYLISPWTDLTESFETHTLKRAVDYVVTDNLLGGANDHYAGGHDKTNPLISPAFGDLGGLPPLLVQVGSHERLLDDSLTIVRNAGIADVPVTLTIWPGYPHVFQFYHRELDGAGKALREAGVFMNAAIDGALFR